mmetsp:Transcript_12300/g.16433  ORF Transcript_12300/g.16433 Transcript_12300/m.16433 type:complete len:93 (+) Transcript_12300:642-920(+)
MVLRLTIRTILHQTLFCLLQKKQQRQQMAKRTVMQLKQNFENLLGKGRNGALCEKKDSELLKSLHEPFAPFQSLSTYYMWRIADTVAFNNND